MIKPNEKKFIVEVFGARYGNELVKRLTKRKVFNADGNQFSSESISMIVCGHRENLRVEDAIIEIAVKEKARRKAAEKRRQKLFKK